jgi:hypothetical protein
MSMKFNRHDWQASATETDMNKPISVQRLDNAEIPSPRVHGCIGRA